MRKIILAATAFCLFAAQAQAAYVTVTQIKASGSGGKPVIDQRLSDIGDKLAKQFKFSRYDYLRRDSDTIDTGASSTLELKTGDFLDMTIDAEETDQNGNVRHTMTVEVYQKTPQGRKTTIVKTTVKNPSGGTFLIGLPESKEIGGTPIIAIKTE